MFFMNGIYEWDISMSHCNCYSGVLTLFDPKVCRSYIPSLERVEYACIDFNQPPGQQFSWQQVRTYVGLRGTQIW